MISFFVPGPPQGKARARTVRGFYGESKTYTPAKTVIYEGLIRGCFREAARSPREPVFRKGVPVRIRIEAYYRPPVRTTKKDYALIQAGKKFPTRKPDLDNVVKAVCDALNRIAYNDDSQVVEIISAKYFSQDEGLRISVSSALEEE